jgi:hypothetical protein
LSRQTHNLVIASEAKQSKSKRKVLDRFVAALLAMTGGSISIVTLSIRGDQSSILRRLHSSCQRRSSGSMALLGSVPTIRPMAQSCEDMGSMAKFGMEFTAGNRSRTAGVPVELVVGIKVVMVVSYVFQR